MFESEMLKPIFYKLFDKFLYNFFSIKISKTLSAKYYQECRILRKAAKK